MAGYGMRELNIAVLGTGRIGSMHTELLQRRVEGARVTAVYDIFADSARAVGSRFGVPVAESPESIFGDPSNAVAICTRTDTHVQVMVEAARAGKAIFCDKPISLDLAQVDHTLAAVSKAGSTCRSVSTAGSTLPTPRCGTPYSPAGSATFTSSGSHPAILNRHRLRTSRCQVASSWT